MTMNAPASHFAHLRDRRATLVALGDSITEVNHTTLGSLNWTGLLALGLAGKTTFPSGFTLINSGKSGDTVRNALDTLEDRVHRHRPDVVIIGYGTNDSREYDAETFRSHLLKLAEAIRARHEALLVWRTPIPLINLASGTELPEYRPGGTLIAREPGTYAEAVRQAAAEAGGMVVDHYASWAASTRHPFRGDLVYLMADPVHPNHLGHRRLYHELAPTFQAEPYLYFEWQRLLKADPGHPHSIP